MKDFLYWWLIVCVIGTGSYITHSMGWLVPLYTNDLTYITFLITVLAALTTLSLGYKFKVPDALDVDIEWFVSDVADVVLTLGMLGTIIGFMIMLEGTFSSIEFNDTDSIRQALSSMSQGLFTALNTTLIGLVSSIILIALRKVVSVQETAIKSGLKSTNDFRKSSTAEFVVFLKCRSSSSLSKTGLFSNELALILSESSTVISSSNL